MSEGSFHEPHRAVHIYVREKALEFVHLTAQEKLAWLEEINALYWAGAMRMSDAADPKRKEGGS